MQPIHLLPPLAFLVAAVAIWAIGRKWAEKPKWMEGWTAADQRRAKDKESERSRDGSRLAALLSARPLVPLVRPKTEREAKRLRLELARAGFSGQYAVGVYLLLRAALIALATVVATGVGLGTAGFCNRTLLTVAAVIGGTFLAPGLFLRWRQKRRQWEIRNTLPEVLDLLSVVIECGHSPDVALQNSVKDLRHSAPILAEEFGLYFRQMDVGRDRFDAIHDLAMRCGIPEMSVFATALVDAHRLGTSVAPTLRDQARHMRILRKFDLEMKARRAVVTLMFPLILFIFPGIFVALVGPAAVMIMRSMMAMQ
jgi:tight adherence protein C